jgi:hypothetical protein
LIGIRFRVTSIGLDLRGSILELLVTTLAKVRLAMHWRLVNTKYTILFLITILLLLSVEVYWATFGRDTFERPPSAPDCAQVVEHRPPDFEWFGPASNESVPTVIKAEDLDAYVGQWVAVQGVLHIQFEKSLIDSHVEWYALFLSWPAPAQTHVQEGLLVSLGTLEPGHAYWVTNRERISDRCVVVEGQLITSAAEGPLLGELLPVRRLSVWSQPTRRLLVEPLRQGSGIQMLR